MKVYYLTSTVMQVGCAIVAALLHYFFLAAFCWMLCEGVIIYLMLVAIFSKFSKRWWFFLILGWGRCFLKSMEKYEDTSGLHND